MLYKMFMFQSATNKELRIESVYNANQAALGLSCIRTGNDVTSYFKSAVIAKQIVENAVLTALGRIFQKRFN